MTNIVDFSELVHFTEKQKEAYRAIKKYKYIFYGGAMGGGKSYWLRWGIVGYLIDLAVLGYRNVRAGLFCEDYPALKDRHLSKIEYEFPRWLGVLNRSDYEFALYSEYGGGILCFRNLDDPSKYQSAEFGIEGVDELTKNKKEVFDFLRTRLRWPKLQDTKFLAASNPGGIGHAWVKDLWMNNKFEPGEREAHLFHFIPAKAIDNPHLPESYFTALEGLPAEMKKAFVEGNWDLFRGQYFTEWSIEQHVVEPFQIPSNWKRFRAYDHGRENPACCLWCVLDYDGNVFVYRELYQSGLNVDQIAQEINRLSEGEEYDWSVADSSIFANTGIVDRGGAETIALSFARNGIVFIPSSKRRVDGWNLMHQYLHWTKDKQPKLRFFNTCYNSIKTIPSLIHDIHHPEDLDTKGEDHSADTMRYFLTILNDQVTPPPLTDVEKKLKQLQEAEQFNFSEFYSGKMYQPEE